MSEDAAVREIVVGVVAEAVREAGAAGVALAAPPGGEREILVSWLADGPIGTLHVPDEGRVSGLAEVLAGGQREAGATDEARRALARSEARRQGLLVASGLTKTLLLLDGPDGSDLYPLGDVWASRVRDWVGSARAPLDLEDGQLLRPLDDALRAWTEDRVPLGAALAPLPDGLREEVERLLRRRLGCGRPPVVPKLTAWTVGVDPPR